MVKSLAALDRREQLLDAALVCFADQGYNAAKVSDIVRRAGVAQGTFYLYFRSKREVLFALVDRFCQALLDVCTRDDAAELPNSVEEYRAAVLARTREILRQTAEHRPLAALFFREAIGADPELECHLRDFHATMAEVSQRRLRQAIDRGFLPPIDVEVVAYAINGMWERVVTHCVLMSPTVPDVDRLAEQIVSLQLDGLLARRS